jgi:hypothetical protein
MSVIGFSSVMNTRRHIRAAENRRAREKKAEKSTDDASSESPERDWEAMAKAAEQERQRRAAIEAERKTAWGEKWSEQTDDRKERMLIAHLCNYDKLSYVGWGKSFFTNAPLGEEESYHDRIRRQTFDASQRLKYGRGYKDVRMLKKVISHYPDQKEYAELLIERIRELDARDGMTPREYRIALRQQKKRGETGDEKAVHSDVMERLGEEIIEAGEATSEDKDGAEK